MRFQVFLINGLCNCHEETVIANNKKEAKKDAHSFNPKSKLLEANWFYK